MALGTFISFIVFFYISVIWEIRRKKDENKRNE